MKKIVTILFLLIISIQFLPIKQMGKCLFNNQFVEEEVCKNIEKSKSTEPGKDLICFDFTPQSFYVETVIFSSRKTALHKPPITDIIAPPPNA